MTHTDVIALFAQDASSCPPSIDRATAALAKFVSFYHLSLSPVAVEVLIAVGGQLMHHGADEWWNSASASSVAPFSWKNKVGENSADVRGGKKNRPRRSVSLHEIQTMVINRQKRYSACDKLVFDAAYRKRPELDGPNWDIEPMPLRGTDHGGVPYDCFCVMESYFYSLKARFDVRASEKS